MTSISELFIFIFALFYFIYFILFFIRLSFFKVTQFVPFLILQKFDKQVPLLEPKLKLMDKLSSLLIIALVLDFEE